MARNAKDSAEIKPSEKIRILILVGKGVTNKALKNLSGLNIRRLNIDGTRVTNSGLEHLEEIKGLRVLRLWSADLTDTRPRTHREPGQPRIARPRRRQYPRNGIEILEEPGKSPRPSSLGLESKMPN